MKGPEKRKDKEKKGRTDVGTESGKETKRKKGKQGRKQNDKEEEICTGPK